MYFHSMIFGTQRKRKIGHFEREGQESNYYILVGSGKLRPGEWIWGRQSSGLSTLDSHRLPKASIPTSPPVALPIGRSCFSSSWSIFMSYFFFVNKNDIETDTGVNPRDSFSANGTNFLWVKETPDWASKGLVQSLAPLLIPKTAFSPRRLPAVKRAWTLE